MKEVVILTVSDIHGYIFPTDYQASHQDLPKGLLKIKSMIDDIKNKHEHVIVMDNGDFLQGSPLCSYLYSQLHSSKDLSDIYNKVGFDFAVIGNHEFNYGLPYLYDTLNSFNFPVLSANILKDNQPFTGHDVIYIDKSDITIGVIGLTTQYIPNWEKPETIEALSFQPAKETASKLIQEVRDLSDIVVVCYHGGFEKDIQTGEPTELITGENEGYDLLNEVEGIDVLITGHQHREIAEKINQTEIIQPGSKGDCLGKITLTIDETTHQISSSHSEILYVKEEEPSINVEDKVLKINDEVNEWLDQNITHFSTPMYVEDHFTARTKPHPLINLLNYVQMEASGADISATALFDSATGFGNDVTMRDIINNYPFPNTFNVLEVTGYDLKLALERSASYFEISNHELTVNPAFLEPKPQHFNYDMFGGLSYTLNIRQPIGERAQNILVKGKPLDIKSTYKIVINNYRSVGGGGYHMFNANQIVKEIQQEGAALIIQYLQNHSVESIPNVLDFEVVY